MSQYMDVYYNVAVVYHMYVHIHTCMQLSTEHAYIFTYMCTCIQLCTYVCMYMWAVLYCTVRVKEWKVLDMFVVSLKFIFVHVLCSVQVNLQFCIICTDEAHDGPNTAQLSMNNCVNHREHKC